MKQTLLFRLFLLYLANVFGSDIIASCPHGYTQPLNSGWTSCYRVYTDQVSKKEATQQCNSDNGTLASVPNAFVNSYISSLTTELDLYYVTLGISCPNGNIHTCVNDDGTPFTYNNFKSGEPNGANGNGVSLSVKKFDQQKWSSYDYQYSMGFVCEIAADVIHDYTCPERYIYFEEVCYKIVNHGSTLSGNDASAECRKIPGGNLATINNAQVNTFLADHEPRKLQGTAFGLRCPNITKDGDTSSCQWDDGTSFGYDAFWTQRNASYFSWNYFPLAIVGSGCCDFHVGKWQDCYPCDDSSRFDSYICQAPEQEV